MTTQDELHVVFGTAALGQAVMRALLKSGKRVRMVSRSGKAKVPAEVEVVKGDASDPNSTRETCQGATTVYNCAAPDYTKWAELYPPMQHGILEGAASAGARLVSAESVYGYGPVEGEMTEESPQAATTRKGRLRTMMSQMVLNAHQSGKVRAAIGRAPDFYGPEAVVTTIYGERVFYPVLAGKKVAVMGKLDNLHTFIYIDDFGTGLATLGQHEEAMGQVWHLPCAPTLTQRELLTMIFEEAGQPAKVGETPGAMVKGLALFIPVMRELEELLYQWERPYRFNHAKFEKAFGSTVTPHREAVRQTVEWFRQHPKAK